MLGESTTTTVNYEPKNKETENSLLKHSGLNVLLKDNKMYCYNNKNNTTNVWRNNIETNIYSRKCISNTILYRKEWFFPDTFTQTESTILKSLGGMNPSASTQTENSAQVHGDTMLNSIIKRRRSESFLLKSNSFSKEIMDMEYDILKHNIVKDFCKVPSSKKLITLHKNENVGKLKNSSISRIPLRTKYTRKNKYSMLRKEQNYLRKKKYTIYAKNKRSRKHSYKTVSQNLVKSDYGNIWQNTLKFGYNFDISSCKKLTQRIKKYGAKWSLKIFQVFADLGVTLKSSLTNLYKLYEAQSFSYCRCNDYQKEIDRLSLKLSELHSDIEALKSRYIEYASVRERIQELSKKLENISKETESFVTVKLQLETLEKEFKNTAPQVMTAVPPPPPPLPPPPVPITYSTSFIRVIKNERKFIEADPSRPIITLEDILKVKLKKISVTNI
ncbi:hypothetical protein HHI36_022037 [Cryptolaemus montrouzieri]|uniref:Translin-associated factor X-interacting protein 1 N-terminal domain-containing protein n=1 Tax=Cryptolaemus montrouzieri TaxID=559131 RepID=A0ABD2MZ03_9CUCU